MAGDVSEELDKEIDKECRAIRPDRHRPVGGPGV